MREVTLDTQTGLEWLDTSLTSNQKYYNYQNGHAGFRVPTFEEVNAFFTNNISSIENPYVHGTVYPNGNSDDLAWMATLLSSNKTVIDYGAVSNGLYRHERGDIELLSIASTYASGLESDYGYTQTSCYFTQGIMLVSDGGVSYSSLLDPSINVGVSDATVPLPATLGLLALSMLGFSARRKSK